MMRGSGPCKDCKEREEYMKVGVCCHSVCPKYLAFDKQNKEIRKRKTNAAILNSIRKDSYSRAPLNNPRKNHRKKI